MVVRRIALEQHQAFSRFEDLAVGKHIEQQPIVDITKETNDGTELEMSALAATALTNNDGPVSGERGKSGRLNATSIAPANKLAKLLLSAASHDSTSFQRTTKRVWLRLPSRR